jgi:hypothetical protein
MGPFRPNAEYAASMLACTRDLNSCAHITARPVHLQWLFSGLPKTLVNTCTVDSAPAVFVMCHLLRFTVAQCAVAQRFMAMYMMHTLQRLHADAQHAQASAGMHVCAHAGPRR